MEDRSIGASNCFASIVRETGGTTTFAKTTTMVMSSSHFMVPSEARRVP
ncbi:hypothetical protein [Verrucomicrobium spinosum]|nr:hypothetical protein [Verrucomicrobium spinosum]